MEEQIYVVDTCDVVFRRKSDGHVVFSYETQLASLSGTLSEEICIIKKNQRITVSPQLFLQFV